MTESVVTFLFSDIEGSTRRWEAHPEAMARDLAQHDEILGKVVESEGGRIFGHTGDGMCAAFPSEPAALAAAVAVQQALSGATWDAPVPLRVRMGVHTGPAQQRAANFFGPTLNRTARLMSVGAGGQVLCSKTVVERVGSRLPTGIGLLDLGEHRLADLARSEQVFQVTHPELLADFPPLRSLGAHRHNLPVAMNAFVGRAAELVELGDHLSRTRLLPVAPAPAARARPGSRCRSPRRTSSATRPAYGWSGSPRYVIPSSWARRWPQRWGWTSPASQAPRRSPSTCAATWSESGRC